MAYYARKEGLDAYSKRKTKIECRCFCCGDIIPAGNYRYATGHNSSLCELCYKAWIEEGGKLGNISRRKSEFRGNF